MNAELIFTGIRPDVNGQFFSFHVRGRAALAALLAELRRRSPSGRLAEAVASLRSEPLREGAWS